MEIRQRHAPLVLQFPDGTSERFTVHVDDVIESVVEEIAKKLGISQYGLKLKRGNSSSFLTIFLHYIYIYICIILVIEMIICYRGSLAEQRRDALRARVE